MTETIKIFDKDTFDLALQHLREDHVLVINPLNSSDPKGEWRIIVIEPGGPEDLRIGDLPPVRSVYGLSTFVFTDRQDAEEFIKNAYNVNFLNTQRQP